MRIFLKNLIAIRVVFEGKSIESQFLFLTLKKIKELKKTLKEEDVDFLIDNNSNPTKIIIDSKTSYSKCLTLVEIIPNFKKTEDDALYENENIEFS